MTMSLPQTFPVTEPESLKRVTTVVATRLHVTPHLDEVREFLDWTIEKLRHSAIAGEYAPRAERLRELLARDSNAVITVSHDVTLELSAQRVLRGVGR